MGLFKHVSRALGAALFIASPVVCISLAAVTPAHAAGESTASEESVEAARADLDQLYKGDYRRAFVEKNPDLFGRHIAPELQYSAFDGTTATGQQLKEIVAGRIATIERVLDHNVTIENVQIDEQGRIIAVVTLTTVLDIRSSTGRVYREISVGTYRDTFIRAEDGLLLEVAAHLLRNHVTTAQNP